MKLDFKSLAFGYKLEQSTSTPAWETSLGQGKEYKIKESASIDELVKGMIYKAVAPQAVSFKKGKGGAIVTGDSESSSLVIASVFDKVYINDKQIVGGNFILLISKDDSKSHSGRLKLKYGPDNAYKNNDGITIKNQDFINLVSEQLELSTDACWFVSDISVQEQDKLILTTTIVNPDGCETYKDSTAHHAAWDPYYSEKGELKPPVSDICDGENIIFYGVPGCGKSYHIENEVISNLKVKDENKIRTTFYQDYSNTDFVGQILPKVTGEKVEYIFNPGPFTLVLIQAYKNPEENVALIVEEINRGNAPAIFGDIFQLLDRKNGVSEYGIKNVQVTDYLNDYNFGKDGADLYYHFDEIKIPGNLYIYATMNTSDQNVYTLDTAFTRRWDKVKIPNNFVKKDDKDYFKKRYVPGTNVLWKTFADAINDHITNNLDNLQVNEDKQLGAFFIKDSALSVEAEVGKRTNKDTDTLKSNFAHKVLDYLWSDVSKFDHSIIFKPTTKDNKNINTLDSLIEEFKKNGMGIFQESILKDMPDYNANLAEESNAIENTDESVGINE